MHYPNGPISQKGNMKPGLNPLLPPWTPQSRDLVSEAPAPALGLLSLEVYLHGPGGDMEQGVPLADGLCPSLVGSLAGALPWKNSS